MSQGISQIDRFDASWSTLEKREGQTLKQLKAIATIRSVGASTRIEGSKMTDDEVEVLLNNLTITKLEVRDEQEVAGYFETLEFISESYREIEINESNLKYIHNMLMKNSEKDAWHKGNYKTQPNKVVAKMPDGSLRDVFRPTDPGFATEEAMANLIDWYKSDHHTLPLIKDSIFVYDLLSIHPFQDGNGRISRLLGTLLLLKHGYSWIQYISFEHEIEFRKKEYDRILMQCQGKRPGEDLAPWVEFFIDCLKNIQSQLQEKLEVQKKNESLSRKEKMINSFVENHPRSRSGEISAKLAIPLPTVKRLLSRMVSNKQLAVSGSGAGTSYTIDEASTIRKDQVMIFTNQTRVRDFNIKNQYSFIELKKIVLTPLFNWTHPDEWGKELARNNLRLIITCIGASGAKIFTPILIRATPFHYQPVFELPQPLMIPKDPWKSLPDKKEFPVQVTIALESSFDKINFEVMVIYDEA